MTLNDVQTTKQQFPQYQETPLVFSMIKIEYTYRRGAGKVYIYILFTALQESDIFVQQFKGDRQQIVVAQNVYLSLITVHQL